MIARGGPASPQKLLRFRLQFGSPRSTRETFPMQRSIVLFALDEQAASLAEHHAAVPARDRERLASPIRLPPARALARSLRVSAE